MKSKIMAIILILISITCIISCTRVIEIYRPTKQMQTEWKSIYDLKDIDKSFVAQGIEAYNNYLFYTVHKKDKGSVLIVFKINRDNSLKYIFKTNFPKEATHVSDLSIYKDYLYAIDYASNNLYKINISKTLQNKKLIVENKIYTNLKRSGSIILTQYKNKDVIFITQFILNNYIKVFYLDDLNKKDKKEIMKIKSKYFIQGLYKKDNKILVSSNKYGNDPIFITNEQELLKTRNLNNKTTIAIQGPGRMIEDITVYNGYIFTSDEETNKIYVTKKRILDYVKKDK